MTNWDIFLFPHNATYDWDKGLALATVNERAGTYSAVRTRQDRD